jgi:CDGSH-type Zn-finger protein
MSRDSERPAAARVTMYPDGPLILRGDFEICSVDGATIETARIVALCRCGRSAAKPLCDGSHKRGELSVTDQPAGDATSGHSGE